MKQIGMLLISVFVMACGQKSKMESDGVYGEPFKATGAISVHAAMQAMQSKSEMEAVIEGTVTEVCKSEGCWLMLKNEGGEDLYIDIAEKKFHLTSNIEGKKVAVKGKLSKEAIPVEELKQMAREDGKSEEEINAITAPKDDVAMEATGLVILK